MLLFFSCCFFSVVADGLCLIWKKAPYIVTHSPLSQVMRASRGNVTLVGSHCSTEYGSYMASLEHFHYLPMHYQRTGGHKKQFYSAIGSLPTSGHQREKNRYPVSVPQSISPSNCPQVFLVCFYLFQPPSPLFLHTYEFRWEWLLSSNVAVMIKTSTP